MITNNEVKISVEKPSGRSERHRPQFHFSPYRNWMNDPNGLITFNGKHHMYYQYNPHGNQWGHMSWGHATSVDLVHWSEHEVAIPEKEHMIFSGTTALDCDGKTLVAAYTSFEHGLNEKGELNALAQHQSIAKSFDGGFSFEAIAENPVIDIQSTEFRDPKLFFDQRTKKWNMLVCLSIAHTIHFYQSADLVTWEKVSEFGPLGNIDAVWECPDLFELKIGDGEMTKWVLTVSAGHPQQGYLGMQYFIGEYDGYAFQADALKYPLYLDYGKDFYAGITFANTGKKECAIMMGWVGCHLYSSKTPTEQWRGLMSLPRELYLSQMGSQTVLKSRPPQHYIEALLDRKWTREGLKIFNGAVTVPLGTKSFVASLVIGVGGAKKAGIQFLKSGNTATEVGLDLVNNEVFFDRSKSAGSTFHEKFPGKDTISIHPDWKSVQLDIFVDHSVVEVFIQDGHFTMTNLVFPEVDGTGIKLYADGGGALFEKVEIRTVKSIWK